VRRAPDRQLDRVIRPVLPFEANHGKRNRAEFFFCDIRICHNEFIPQLKNVMMATVMNADLHIGATTHAKILGRLAPSI